MNALHLSHTAGLLLTSFGAGIGLVTAAIVLNYISDAMRRVKERRNRPPSLSEHDMQRMAQAARPMQAPRETAMPMVQLRRNG